MRLATGPLHTGINRRNFLLKNIHFLPCVAEWVRQLVLVGTCEKVNALTQPLFGFKKFWRVVRQCRQGFCRLRILVYPCRFQILARRASNPDGTIWFLSRLGSFCGEECAVCSGVFGIDSGTPGVGILFSSASSCRFGGNNCPQPVGSVTDRNDMRALAAGLDGGRV